MVLQLAGLVKDVVQTADPRFAPDLSKQIDLNRLFRKSCVTVFQLLSVAQDCRF